MEQALSSIELNTIEEAIEEIKAGKVVIVVDDEDRENEGDFVTAAETITPEVINFMATHGRGLICSPITQERARKLGLSRMVNENTDMHGTAFTVSVDYRLKGCTTGISAYDRATGIKALTEDETVPTDYNKPGHIFPLIAKEGGVLRRTGHTEATVDLAKLAGFKPAGVLVEILNQDGTMARLPQLVQIAKQHDLKIITIKDLVAWRMERERLIEIKNTFPVETACGTFEMITVKEKNSGMSHIAFKKGDWEVGDPVLTRVHSSTNSAELLSFMLKGEDHEFYKTLRKIDEEGQGLLLLLRQEDKEDTLEKSLDLLMQQTNNEEDIDLFPKNTHTIQRGLGIGAQILFDLKIRKMRLLTNSTRKRVGLVGYSLEVVETVPI